MDSSNQTFWADVTALAAGATSITWGGIAPEYAAQQELWQAGSPRDVVLLLALSCDW